MGVTPSWPTEASRGERGGVRSRVRARQKAPEWDDRQTDRRSVHYMMIEVVLDLVVMSPRRRHIFVCFMAKSAFWVFFRP